MSNPQQNDTVAITYIGKLDNGEIFTTFENDKPLHAQIGNSELPPTLEEAVVKLKVGEQCKVRVPPEEGFGPRQKDLLQTLDNQEMVEKLKPVPGMVLSLKIDKEGVEQSVPATVIEVDGFVVTVDYNHPLAGHHLNYEITLIGIEKSGN